MHRYITYNGPRPTTAAQQTVSTGTSIKTMLQLATPSTRQLQVISWGFSLSAPPNGVVELLQTDVGATITQSVANDITALDPNAPASLLDISSTTKTGYSASGEGAITATRVLDSQILGSSAGNNELNYSYQFMPDERPILAVSKFLRVRVTFGTSVNMQCWICWDE